MDSAANYLELTLGVLDYAAKATPLFLVVAGLLGYYYREKIKIILARSLAIEIEQLKAKFAVELAQQQASAQRELEAYKVGLISETERIKAAQDVRTSIALKFYEKRFSAIIAILDAHVGIDTDISTILTFDFLGNSAAFDKLSTSVRKRLKAYGTVYESTALFMSDQMRRHIVDFQAAAYKAYRLRGQESDPLIATDSEDVDKMIKLAIALENELKREIVNHENFGENSKT